MTSLDDAVKKRAETSLTSAPAVKKPEKKASKSYISLTTSSNENKLSKIKPIQNADTLSLKTELSGDKDSEIQEIVRKAINNVRQLNSDDSTDKEQDKPFVVPRDVYKKLQNDKVPKLHVTTPIRRPSGKVEKK